MERWWEARYQSRYLEERERLQAAGLLISEEREDNDQLVWHIDGYEHQGTPIPFIVKFPVLYPYFKFILQTNAVTADRHISPIEGVICYLPRDTGMWNPATDYVADIIMQRIPLVLDTGNNPNLEDRKGMEEPFAEPNSVLISSSPNTSILVGNTDVSPEHDSGFMVLRRLSRAKRIAQVISITDTKHNKVYEADFELTSDISGRVSLPWLRINGDFSQISRQFKNNSEALTYLLTCYEQSGFHTRNQHHEFIGFLISEENQYGAGLSDSWIFLGRN